jgi:DNA processing protein
VIVVEGAPGSGSMITVDYALQLGRDVWAVPGPVTAPLSAVPNELIRGGAALVRSVDDLLAELGLPSVPPEAERDLPPDAAEILAVLSGHPEEAEALAARAGRTAPEVLQALLELEMRGLARRVGGRFERTLRAGR